MLPLFHLAKFLCATSTRNHHPTYDLEPPTDVKGLDLYPRQLPSRGLKARAELHRFSGVRLHSGSTGLHLTGKVFHGQAGMGQAEAGAAGGMMVPDDAQGLENAVHEANAIGSFTLKNVLASVGHYFKR